MIPEHVYVSRGISKLGEHIPSVNLPPVITCRPDAPCYALCYARKGRFSFRHTRDLLQRNLEIWKADPEGFKRDVFITAFQSRFFRWHSSGDIPDADYLDMMVWIARECDRTEFLCFTKKHEIVNGYIGEHGLESIPKNLHLVLSAWGDFVPPNPHNLPMAYVRLKGGEAAIPENANACSGYCGECVRTRHSCWDLQRGTGDCVVFNQH